MNDQVTIELSEGQRLRLEEIADFEEFPLVTLRVRAAERIIEADQQFCDEVDQGRAAIARGEWSDHVDVPARSVARRRSASSAGET